MPNLSELNEYKKTLVKAIVSDQDCVDLIVGASGTALPAKSLIDDEAHINQIHLYDYIPLTTDQDRVHVCIEAFEGEQKSGNVRTYILEVDVICPESMMRMTGAVRRDSIAAAIDELICGSSDYGFGFVESLPGQTGIPVEGFRGRRMRYRISGWNQKGARV